MESKDSNTGPGHNLLDGAVNVYQALQEAAGSAAVTIETWQETMYVKFLGPVGGQ